MPMSTFSSFALARQHSAEQTGQCPICREAVGATREEAADVRMGCRCGLHYSCLVQYLHAKLGDRGSLSLRGVCCPSGAQCVSFAGSSPYFITLADLDNLVDYGAREAAAAALVDSVVPPLTHDKVADLRAWLEESAALEGLRAFLGDPTVTDDERKQLPGVAERGEAAFDALVRRGMEPAAGGQGGQGEKQPELTAELAAALRARLRPLREGYTDELDPFVAATTKACPTCSMRSTHWHGHQCHHISPATRGCPSCHVHFCYRCLATEADNEQSRGGRGNCLCGYWSNFCRGVTSEQDVAAFVAYRDGIPFDSRCGCVICPECRFEQPCASCSGDCGACRGVLNPAPGQANPPSKWVALRTRVSGATLAARLREACRQGYAESLAAVLAEAGEGAAGLVNGRDREGRTCLHNACDGGHAACVAMLLAVPGIDANIADRFGYTALRYLVQDEGHTEVVRALLAAPGIDVNKADNRGLTAVMEAASRGHTVVVRALLAAPDIDLNKADNDGWTAVMWAARCGHTEVVRALLAAPGIDLNKRATAGFCKGLTALGMAILRNKPEAAALLRAAAAEESEADMVLVAGKRIYDAAKAGDVAALRPLLQEWSGHDVLNWGNPVDDRYTPLIISSKRGKIEAVELLEATPGIDVNKADIYGRTAAMLAARYGHIEVVRALLAAPGIDVNKAGNDGWTAVMLAAIRGHTEVMRALLAVPGIDVNKADSNGYTAVMTAANNGHIEVVRALVAVPDIDLNKGATDGWTAVMWAARCGHTEVVRALLAAPGIDVNKAGNDGWTAVMWAAENGHIEVARALLAAPGIDVNMADSNGYTAVMTAAENGHIEVVRALAAVPDIDLNKRATGGKTALGIAILKNNPEAAALLRAAGAEAEEEDKAALVRLVGDRIFGAAKEDVPAEAAAV